MQIVIIGNGISGITAAINIRNKSDHSILIISKESDYFFSRTALMYVYMGHMKFNHLYPYENWYWKKNNIDLLQSEVNSIDFKNKQIILKNEKHIPYDKLIIATGSISTKYGWKGQDLKGVQGLYTKQDLESLEKISQKIQKAVIVGGGLIGIELAEMLHSRGIQTVLLIREKEYWNNVLPIEEAKIISNHIQAHGIELIISNELEEIIGDKNGYVEKIITKNGKEIECQFVGLTTGVQPNIEFLQSTEIAHNKGILVNEYFESNIEDVYAIGDCAELIETKNGFSKIEQLWYTGKMHGETVSEIILGNRKKYDRGIWFNSAKFLDIEYQTYGLMFSKLKEEEDTFYWEHPNGKVSFRMNFQKENLKIIGFNFLGIRYKQTIADAFIREGKDIFFVMDNIEKGNFDPEFSKNYFKDIKNQFKMKFKLEISNQ